MLRCWLRTLFAILLIGPSLVHAQVPTEVAGDVPIEILADSGTQYDNETGVATASGNVTIFAGEATLYADRAEYNVLTKDILLEGNVRIYHGKDTFIAESALYNTATQDVRAADFDARFAPFIVGAQSLITLGPNTFEGTRATLTTHDSSKPDWFLQARKVRIYRDDRVVFRDVLLYVGRTPIFWFPYLYQPLNDQAGFSIAPGYRNDWGAYALTSYTFPVSDKWSGTFHLDLRARRGVGFGLDSENRWGRDDRSYFDFRSYLIDDQDPNENLTGLPRPEIDPSRYRVSFRNRTYFTEEEDLYLSVNVNKLSDAFVLEDFFPSEFSINPQPDNQGSLTYVNEALTGNLLLRGQLNDFFETTERLPEAALDVNRQMVFGLPIYYQSESAVGYLQRNFPEGSGYPDYAAMRLDSFHQLSYPQMYFGWLSVVPRIGFRGTYYSESAMLPNALLTFNPSFPNQLRKPPPRSANLQYEGDTFRPVLNAGMEISFKASRPFENIQSRAWGLDGVRHVIQPYLNYSFVENFGKPPEDILQFDRRLPSTQLDPIDFPQFNSIDSIDDWNILRLGMRNRLQTRRDNLAYNWLEVDTFFEVNIQNPYFSGTISNIFNVVSWQPLPWAEFRVETQFPVEKDGFTELNSEARFLPFEDMEVFVGHRFLKDNPFFRDSNLLRFGGYYRLNDNWAVSVSEQVEIVDGTLESQQYTIHRDLTSWVASLGAVVYDNRGGQPEYGVQLSFTLKEFPRIRLPVNFDPAAGSNKGSGE